MFPLTAPKEVRDGVFLTAFIITGQGQGWRPGDIDAMTASLIANFVAMRDVPFCDEDPMA